MRDKRFIAEHRGGLLTKKQHKQLIIWACTCSEHILSLIENQIDDRLKKALIIAREWEKENATVEDARQASINSHALARELSNPISIAIARSIGQAVATAHMADHSIGASLYALKAVKLADKSVDKERGCQDNQLPPEIKELVISAREEKRI